VKFPCANPKVKYLLDLSDCPGGQRSFIESVQGLGEIVESAKKHKFMWNRFDDQAMLTESLNTLDKIRATTPFKTKPELHRFDVSRHPAGEDPNEDA
jgi:hypothetical protein